MSVFRSSMGVVASAFAKLLPLLLGPLGLLSALSVLAGEPPVDPILRIETGMHTAVIGHIGLAAQGRWLVTASDDKTLRVWDRDEGGLLQILRPPIGPGDEGKLYSVAMSPDGEWIAAGGWTHWDWDGKAAIYLFQRSSGRLVRRITDLPGTICDLAWSLDGRWLAAGLGRGGIRLYRSGDFVSAGEDRDYGGSVYGLDFNRAGHLVVSSYDGALRLYQVDGNGLQRLVKRAVPGGKRPFAVRFSPDGRQVAVGFMDSSQVNVLASDSLNFLFAPDTAALSPQDFLFAVAWSADGQTLYAGGTATMPGRKVRMLRTWSQGGRGRYRDLPAANDTTFDIRSLTQGGVLFSAADPAWGSFDATGTRRRLVTAGIVDFRDSHEDFRLAADGRTLSFHFELSDKAPVRFGLNERRYQAMGSTGDLFNASLVAPGLNVSDWKNNSTPRLNGHLLPLQQYETARSLALAPDQRGFVLGTGWYLRRFDASGQQVWVQNIPGDVWALNISRDGRLAVAAYADGTIRWHRYSDGQEMLALFPHKDKKRWVLWTPSGYYDASPGGEDLIGWHINRGRNEAADFFPASRLRSRFYRPDVISHVLETLDEDAALRLADQEAGRRTSNQPLQVAKVLPPVVEILAPTDGSTVSGNSIVVHYRTRALPDAPVVGLRLRVNGQAVSHRDLVGAPSGADGEVRTLTVSIPDQDSEVMLFADNRNGTSSPAILRLRWDGNRSKENVLYKPKLYVLAVGVAQYANPDFNLDLAAKDATDFSQVLLAQKGALYADVQVRLLTDQNATKDDVLDGLEWLRHSVTSRDVGIMFLAGHGVNDPGSGNYYFLPHNADPRRLLRTGVAQNDIKQTLNSLAGKALFFVDTCHSGNVLGTAKTRGVGGDINAFVSELASAENGVVVFTAATGRQSSLEDLAWGNGAFTKAVVEGLKGKADFQRTGRITHKGLDYYIAERVKELTRGEQSPVSIAPQGVSDFPIAVVN